MPHRGGRASAVEMPVVQPTDNSDGQPASFDTSLLESPHAVTVPHQRVRTGARVMRTSMADAGPAHWKRTGSPGWMGDVNIYLEDFRVTNSALRHRLARRRTADIRAVLPAPPPPRSGRGLPVREHRRAGRLERAVLHRDRRRRRTRPVRRAVHHSTALHRTRATRSGLLLLRAGPRSAGRAGDPELDHRCADGHDPAGHLHRRPSADVPPLPAPGRRAGLRRSPTRTRSSRTWSRCSARGCTGSSCSGSTWSTTPPLSTSATSSAPRRSLVTAAWIRLSAAFSR